MGRATAWIQHHSGARDVILVILPRDQQPAADAMIAPGANLTRKLSLSKPIEFGPQLVSLRFAALDPPAL